MITTNEIRKSYLVIKALEIRHTGQTNSDGQALKRLGVFVKLGRIRGQILVKFWSKSEIGCFE